MSSNYYTAKSNKNKFVVTIDQYGLRDLGGDFFNPIQQYVKDFVLFKKLVPTQHKTAILMNDSFYKTQKDWSKLIAGKLKEKGCSLAIISNKDERHVTEVVDKLLPDIFDIVKGFDGAFPQ